MGDGEKGHFLTELRRRNVFKVGIAYAVVGWVLAQGSSIFLPNFGAPAWVMPVFLGLIIAGFPIALIITWAFELTPEGVQRSSQPSASTIDAAGNITATAPTDQSIAVLPFVNMSEDPANEYFSDGIAEELLNQLARVSGLHVAGRTSSFSFKGKGEDLRVIGRKLDVAHVLEGSVRKSGDRVRITAQLINVANGYHMWSETYDRTLEDIFTIQDDIAQSVVKSLQITLGVGELGHIPGMTRNVAAYDAYLAGRFMFNQLGRENYSRAIDQLEQALSLDPDFGLAWVQLGEGYLYAANVFIVEKAGEYTAKGETALARAVGIAPDSVPALIAAAVLCQQRREMMAEEQSYKKVLTLAPANCDANMGYGSFLCRVCRPTEAIEYLQRAVRVEPLAPTVYLWLGHAYELCGNRIAAEMATKRSKELSDQSDFANINLIILAMEENNRALIEEYAALLVNSELTPDVIRLASRDINQVMPALLDTPDAAGAELRRFLNDPAYNKPFIRSAISTWASYYGEYELSLQVLQEVSMSTTYFDSQIWRPLHKPMRRLPGFKDLVTKLGLVDYWRATGNWGEFCHPVGDDDFECI